MVRSGQMILANALIIYLLGGQWRRSTSTLNQHIQHKQVCEGREGLVCGGRFSLWGEGGASTYLRVHSAWRRGPHGGRNWPLFDDAAAGLVLVC